MLPKVAVRFGLFIDRLIDLKHQVGTAHERLKLGNVISLVGLLERIVRNEPTYTIHNLNESALRVTINALCSNSRITCLSELDLNVEPYILHSQDGYDSLDLFFPGSVAPCIVLKSIKLTDLLAGEYATPSSTFNGSPETFREALCDETEEQLLERKIICNGIAKSLKEINQEVFEQIIRYVEVIGNGVTDGNHPGVKDYRTEQSQGTSQLIGYVIILVGGTRVLAWHVLHKETDFILMVKRGVERPPLLC
ncbi:hypothetical protein CPB86DRAFT_17160 [Serendipita vermifera]|nr:hypothetical protein CPB86DRAFT_17160 [Serendipita vermifera]